MRRLRVLLVDDDPGFLARFQAVGARHFEFVVARSGAEALRRLAEESPEAVLLDVDLGREPGGVALVGRIREDDPLIPIVMVSADDRLETVLAAMKAGANDYVPKHANMEALRLKIQQALEQGHWREYARRLQPPGGAGLVGGSPAMQRLREAIARVGRTDHKVLITGPSGSGKGLAARALHEAGLRRDHRFVSMNAASVPDSMYESELIGHERGSFTGAERRRVGWLELASGGTFFLDEIDTLTPERQAKLLHVVDEGRLCRLGGSEPIDIDIRLITATNRDLRGEVAAGKFREDLYYRINEYELAVPPLRDRLEDIPELVGALLARERPEPAGPVPAPAPEALEPLYDHDWPGNVRELGTVLKRALLFSASGEELTAGGVAAALETVRRPASPRAGQSPGEAGTPFPHYMQGSYRQGLEALELDFAREFLKRELVRSGGNKSKAAARLGLKRIQLYNLMRRTGLPISPDD